MPDSNAILQAKFGLAWHVNDTSILLSLAYISGAGTPNGAVTPDHIGQEYFDTTNLAWYTAYGTTSTSWGSDSGPSGAIGYAPGAGGTVSQITSRATGVTLSKLTGQITTMTSSLAAAAHADFVVTNTLVAATDVVIANITSGGTGSPRVDVVAVAAGSFNLRVTNDHASTADTSADIINFAVIKGAAS